MTSLNSISSQSGNQLLLRSLKTLQLHLIDSDRKTRDPQFDVLESEDELSALNIHIRRAFGVWEAPGVERSGEGDVPSLAKGSRAHFLGYSDCVGGSETEIRREIHEVEVFNTLPTYQSAIQWKPVKSQCASELGTILASGYFEHRLAFPEGAEYSLVILGNTASRPANNPSAKGCPFVAAFLEGNVIYIGTLSGAELSQVKPYIKEVWVTDLGVEESGTSQGERPDLVYRSRRLTELAARVLNGDEGALQRRISVDDVEGVDYSHPTIGAVDEHGNVKVLQTRRELEKAGIRVGDKIDLTLNGRTITVPLVQSLSDGDPGDLVFAYGSSPRDPYDRRIALLDLYRVNGDAAVYLQEITGGSLTPGETISLTKSQD